MTFDRLIRFRDDTGLECIGEPLIDNIDDLFALAKDHKLEAEVFEGSSPASSGLGTGKQTRVAEILPLLYENDVPIIRCIGLNYIKHSTFQVLNSTRLHYTVCTR